MIMMIILVCRLINYSITIRPTFRQVRSKAYLCRRIEHHRCLVSTKLHSFATDAQLCEQLPQGR